MTIFYFKDIRYDWVYLVCPGICMEYSISSCRPVITRQHKYPSMYWFLFWPVLILKKTTTALLKKELHVQHVSCMACHLQCNDNLPEQLSACRKHFRSPNPFSVRAWSSMLMTAFGPFVNVPSCP